MLLSYKEYGIHFSYHILAHNTTTQNFFFVVLPGEELFRQTAGNFTKQRNVWLDNDLFRCATKKKLNSGSKWKYSIERRSISAWKLKTRVARELWFPSYYFSKYFRGFLKYLKDCFLSLISPPFHAIFRAIEATPGNVLFVQSCLFWKPLEKKRKEYSERVERASDHLWLVKDRRFVG